jgi:fibronectin type 3 domain-containing protein
VTTADLSWDAVDGATYNVYRNDTVIASGVTETTYHDTGLTGGTTYSYAVTAVIAGVESPKSTIELTTTASGG